MGNRPRFLRQVGLSLGRKGQTGCPLVWWQESLCNASGVEAILEPPTPDQHTHPSVGFLANAALYRFVSKYGTPKLVGFPWFLRPTKSGYPLHKETY